MDKIGRNDEISLRELILATRTWVRYLVSKWRIFVISIFVGVFLGYFYGSRKNVNYIAELSFALEDEEMSGIRGSLGLANQFGLNVGVSEGVFSGENLARLMKSRVMIEKTLLTQVSFHNQIITLADLYILTNGYKDTWKKNETLKNIRFDKKSEFEEFSLNQNTALSILYSDITNKNLVVDKLDEKVSIMVVRVKSPNELFSKNFCEALVTNVSNFYIQTKTGKSVENVNILQRQTDSVRRELNKAISGVASSYDLNPNANSVISSLRVPSQRRQVDVQANQAILTELVKNLEVARVALRKETPLIQVIDSPILPLKVEKISTIKAAIIGGLLLAFLSGITLIIKKVFENIMRGA